MIPQFLAKVFPQMAMICLMWVSGSYPLLAQTDLKPVTEKTTAGEGFFPVSTFLDSSYDALTEFASTGHIPVLATDDVLKIYQEKTAILIDAREPDEFAAEHIPGALNIPYDSVYAPALQPQIAQINKDDRLLVYCNTHLCIVSHTCAENLLFLGFQKVIIAEGFWRWKEMGLPVEIDSMGE